MTVARIRDFAAYTVIGVVFVLAVIWTTARYVDFKWVALAFETCLVWVATVGTSRLIWRHGAFWIALCVLLGIHLIGFGVVLRAFKDIEPHVLLATFVVTFIFEMSVLGMLCEAAVKRWMPRGPRSQDRVYATSTKSNRDGVPPSA